VKVFRISVTRGHRCSSQFSQPFNSFWITLYTGSQKVRFLLYSSDSHARSRHQVHSFMAGSIFFDSDCEIYVLDYSLWYSLTAFLLNSHVGFPSSVPWLSTLSFSRIEVTPAKFRPSAVGRNCKFTNIPYSFIDIMGQYDRPIWDSKPKEMSSHYHDITNMSLFFFFELLLVIIRI
jgi:hypothetical protein